MYRDVILCVFVLPFVLLSTPSKEASKVRGREKEDTTEDTMMMEAEWVSQVAEKKSLNLKFPTERSVSVPILRQVSHGHDWYMINPVP